MLQNFTTFTIPTFTFDSLFLILRVAMKCLASNNLVVNEFLPFTSRDINHVT